MCELKMCIVKIIHILSRFDLYEFTMMYIQKTIIFHKCELISRVTRVVVTNTNEITKLISQERVNGCRCASSCH